MLFWLEHSDLMVELKLGFVIDDDVIRGDTVQGSQLVFHVDNAAWPSMEYTVSTAAANWKTGSHLQLK